MGRHPGSLSRPVDLVVLELRVGYNPGVAFGLAGTVPAGFLVAATAVLTAGIFIYAVVASPWLGPWTVAGTTLVAGGALGNLVDRAMDGRVTDYMHSGWFPTFNLADVGITLGVACVVIGARQDGWPSGRAASGSSIR
jgi:signal peptidase II